MIKSHSQFWSKKAYSNSSRSLRFSRFSILWVHSYKLLFIFINFVWSWSWKWSWPSPWLWHGVLKGNPSLFKCGLLWWCICLCLCSSIIFFMSISSSCLCSFLCSCSSECLWMLYMLSFLCFLPSRYCYLLSSNCFISYSFMIIWVLSFYSFFRASFFSF